MASVGHVTRKATDRLSAVAIGIMNGGFRNKKTSAAIAREIEAETRERVNPRTVGRRASEWRELMKGREVKKEQMRALVEAMDEGNLTASAMIKGLALQALMDDPESFTKQNPLKVQSQNLRAEELIIKRDTLRLKEREVAVSEARLRLMQEREQRVLATAEELEKKVTQGNAITPEDLRRIRDVYGLN